MTVIQDVFSNSIKDLKTQFGENRESLSKESDQKEMDKILVTQVCHAGRDIRQFRIDLLNTLSFGYYHPKHRVV